MIKRTTLLLTLLLGSSRTTHAADLQASDGAARESFGNSAGRSGSMELGGACLDQMGSKTHHGAAYVAAS